MPFVLDSSVTIVWAMDDESHPLADLAFLKQQSEGALVPAIWYYEVRNILVMNERRGRISSADSDQFLRQLTNLRIRQEPTASDGNLPDLARKFRLTVYDAAYLELALRARLPLATLDNALRTAAEAAGISLLG
jgi:predicted nucleic acid-binding protein